MSTRLYQKPDGTFANLRARFDNSLRDPEQVFEWSHTGRRRIFRNLCNFPFAMVDWHITNPTQPYFPPSIGNAQDKTDSYSGFISSNIFTGHLVKMAADTAFKFGLSGFVKTSVMGYNKSANYRRVVAMSDELLALSFTARHHDAGSRRQTEIIRQNQSAPLYKLFTQAKSANEVMTRFCQGTLPMTADNMALLRESLSAISLLCEQKAGIPESTQGQGSHQQATQLAKDLSTPSGQALLHHSPELVMPGLYSAHGRVRPSQHIREALEAPHIHQLAQAQTYLATLSALITDGCFSIASDIYRPKDDLFLSAHDTVRMTGQLEETLTRHGLRLNRDAQGNPVNANFSANLMIDKSGQVASAETMLKIAQDIKSQMGWLNKKLDRMLAYADAHYAEIDGLIAAENLQIDTRQQAEKQSLLATQKWQKIVTPIATAMPGASTHKRGMPANIYQPVKPELSYLFRPQAQHEMWKLFSREIPMYLLQMPVNVITRTLIGDVKQKDIANIATPDWVPGNVGKWLYKNLQGSIPSRKNLLSSAWQLATIPAAQAFPGVVSYEATRLGEYTAVESAKKMDEFLGAATIAAYEADSSFAKHFHAYANDKAIVELTNRYAAVLTKPADQRTAKDYTRLAAYFSELSAASEQLFEAAYRPLAEEGKTDFQSFKDHTTKILAQGAKTTGDALKILHLLRFIHSTATSQILSMEYVPQEEVVVGQEQLKTIADKILHYTQQDGFAVQGMRYRNANGTWDTINCPGAKAGQLLTYDPTDNHYRPASTQELVTYANQSLTSLREKGGVDITQWMEITQGKLSDTYMRKLEESFMEDVTFPVPPALRTSVENSITPSGASTHAPDAALRHRPDKKSLWQQIKAHFLRPELLHEMHLQRDRYGFVAIFGLPVKMLEGVLRGDVENAFTPANIKSSLFHGLANTFVVGSYGALALREVTTFHGQKTIDSAREACGVLNAAIASASTIDPAIATRYAALHGSNGLLAAMEKNPHFYTLPTILAKSAERRSPIEKKQLEDFYTHTGDRLIESALQGITTQQKITTDGTSQKDMRAQLLSSLLEKDAHSMEDAVALLAGINALVTVEADFVNVLREERTQHHYLSTKALHELSEYANDKAYNMGLRSTNTDRPLLTNTDGSPAASRDIIGYANAVAAKARTLLLQQTLPQNSFVIKTPVERYVQQRNSSIAQNIL